MKTNYPQFIRISQDTIVNVDEIDDIVKYEDAGDFMFWQNMYDTEINNKFDIYIKENNIDITNLSKNDLNNLKKTVTQKYDKEIKNKIGEKPNLYSNMCYVSLSNGLCLQISDKAYKHICKILNIKINDTNIDPSFSLLDSHAIHESYFDKDLYNGY